MGFDASQAVEPLDYDFTQYAPDARGVIPEPSQDLLDQFERASNAGTNELGLDQAQQMRISAAVASDSPDLARLLADLPAEIIERMQDPNFRAATRERMLDAMAELCQGTPSRDEIAALPPRVREAFQNWLALKFFQGAGNPTPPNPATRHSPAARNGAAIAG